MTHTKPPAHLTTAEAASALRLSIDTIQRQITEGRMPARKIGRRWLIPASYIESRLNVKP
jgi:excisionase family DNA binding protein